MEQFYWDKKEEVWIAKDGNTWDWRHPRLIGGRVNGIFKICDSLSEIFVCWPGGTIGEGIFTQKLIDGVSIYVRQDLMDKLDIKDGDKVIAEIFPTIRGMSGKHDITFTHGFINRLDRRL